ncbi:hypothetical protein AB0K15_13165 [Amycolatopsis sp. NPDC049253]|uniref:hypothetical protein n=1 Tax=Amycolatopsis sp. NPDC049253 TaxID=3155274 RepID=UPI00341DEFC4
MRIIALWCALAVVASLAVLVDSFLPGAPHLPLPVLFTALVGIFPVVGIVFAAVALRRSELPVATIAPRLLRLLPAMLRWGAPLVIAGAAIVAVLTGPRAPAGAPEITPGGYLMDTRDGDYPISASEYLHAQAENRRLFAAISIALNTAAGTGAFALRPQSRRQPRLDSKKPT